MAQKTSAVRYAFHFHFFSNILWTDLDGGPLPNMAYSPETFLWDMFAFRVSLGFETCLADLMAENVETPNFDIWLDHDLSHEPNFTMFNIN